MTYYPTLAEDLARAKEILHKAGPSAWERANFTPEVIEALRQVGHSHIAGADIPAAYKLLESFVEVIEQLQLDQRMLATTLRNIVVAVSGDDNWEGSVADAVDLLNQRFVAINTALHGEGDLDKP